MAISAMYNVQLLFYNPVLTSYWQASKEMERNGDAMMKGAQLV